MSGTETTIIRKALEDIRDRCVPDIHQHSNALDQAGMGDVADSASDIAKLADDALAALEKIDDN